MIRWAALVALAIRGVALPAQSTVIRFQEQGPGVGPVILHDALAGPHATVEPASSSFVVARDAQTSQTLIVLGRDVILEGHVRGDVIVVAGDLYMHPGGEITGRAISIGGGVYESSLAPIAGGVRVFSDFTYDLLPIENGWALRYRSLDPPVTGGWALPGVFGATLPSYDRSDGISLGMAPRYTSSHSHLTIVPGLVYRSQLGEIDPSVAVTVAVHGRASVEAAVQRGTLTNEDWIRPDVMNAAAFFLSGHDTRNYYRASFATVRLRGNFESTQRRVTPYIAMRWERAESVGPGSERAGGPWTLFGRADRDRDDRLRRNPEIDPGDISSFLTGAEWEETAGDLLTRIRLHAELGTFGRRDGGTGSTFGQVTADGRVDFSTFGTQSLAIRGHFVVTPFGNTPRQRYAYVGGPGTLPTLQMLGEGGDQLVYLDAVYRVPLGAVTFPLVGPPTFAIREVLAGSGIGTFPTIHQAVGARLEVKLIYAELLVDPITRTLRGGVSIRFAP